MQLKISNLFYWKNSKTRPLAGDKRAEPATVPDEFTNCSDLPMLNFIKITVTGDLKWLGRCANPEKLWEAIHSEYCELSGDQSSSRGLELAKQIGYLTNRINITHSIIHHLATRGRIDELIDELKNMGYRLAYTDLNADLQRTIALSKSDQMKLANVKEQYAAMETGEKTTEFNWYQMLSALAKHRGVMTINPAMISVVEYVCMEREFRDYCNAMKSMHK